jgi:4-carboxymuconolactone decarboxylase
MRLTPLREEDLVGERRELFDALVHHSVGRDRSFVFDDAGNIRGPLGPLLLHPRSGRPLQQLAAALRFSGTLPDLAREVVILVVAAHWRDAHEWSAHEALARGAGLGDEQLLAIHDGADVVIEDPVAQAACAVARAVLRRGDLSDAEHDAASVVLDEEQFVEVTVLVGYYWLLAMQLRVFRVPGPADFDAM